MSQRDLAEAVGRSEGWVSQVERGVQPVNRLPVLQMLATALGVSVQELNPQAPSPAGNDGSDEMEPGQRSNDLDAVRLMLSGHPALSFVLVEGRGRR